MKKNNYEHYASIRDSQGLRDCDVSRATGIGQAIFSQWKSGRCVPKVDKMKLIAEALNVGIEEFI